MDSTQAQLFKVLGVDSRIRIIELLKERGPLCVNKLSEILRITPSAVSQHLKVLRQAGLVKNEREGYWIHYHVDPAALEECREHLSRVCTCGCVQDGMICGPTLGRPRDELRPLRQYQRRLQEELERVRRRIEELEGEA